jgi:signal transduction histidine kinase
MTGSRRPKRNAFFGFMLITALVLGGVSWATVSQIELARRDLEEVARVERDRKINRVIGEMEDIVGPALAIENARSYREYISVSTPANLYTRDTLDPLPYGSAVTPSVLLEEGAAPWNELYFQIDHYEEWSSPQIPGVDVLRAGADGMFEAFQVGQAPERLSRLHDALPFGNLRSRLEAVFHAEQHPDPSPDADSSGEGAFPACSDPNCPCHLSRFAVVPGGSIGHVGLNQRLGALRPPTCLHPDLIHQNLRNARWEEEVPPTDAASAALSDGENVEVSYTRFVPIWLPAPDAGPANLVFAREVNAGGDILYQGFTIRWDLLKRVLREPVGRVFPEANLVPVDWPAAQDGGVAQMRTIPVRLEVPPIEPVPTAAAWASVSRMLTISWAAALALLAVAGVGFRNMVALTERRLQFAYAVTHELRTPLTTFQLYSDMLSAGLVPESSRQEYLDTLIRESKRLADLVEGVLDYARLENHKVRIHPVTTDAPALGAMVSDRFAERCTRHGAELRVENRVANGKRLTTDVELVQQVLGVLINNACRHVLGGDKEPRIFVALSAKDDRVMIDVIDTGKGIDRTDARRVFKPFRQGRGAAADACGGIGLGLALARNWATLLGGRLELVERSHPKHKGAHFRLTVPDQLTQSGSSCDRRRRG